jgi:hypothetical protein
MPTVGFARAAGYDGEMADENKIIARVARFRMRMGSEQPAGWLPPGAAKPLPTPKREVVVDFSIETDGTSFFLIQEAQDKSFCWDSWHESLEDAKRFARNYGVSAQDWIPNTG